MIFKTPSYLHQLLVFLALLFIHANSKAQCLVPPASGSCSGGNGAATDGVNINSGQTFWYTATGTFANGINLGGGTLRICGNLTLSSLNFNSGSILIEAGGSLTINGSGALNMNGNSIISNRGSLTINRGVTLQNSNNTIFNATPGSVLNINSGTHVLTINGASSSLINNGTASIHTIIVQGSASGNPVCLGSASCLNLTNLTNNLTNSFNVDLALAVVRYTGNALLNNNLTGSANVVVCQATGSTTSGSANFGSATVISNCASCGSAFQILPIELVLFQGQQEEQIIQLRWSTSTPTNPDYFTVEKSMDRFTWRGIGNIPGAVNSTQPIQYLYMDINPMEGIQYYRLKENDSDGSSSYSNPIVVKFHGASSILSIYPNPNSSRYLSIPGGDENYSFELRSITGKLLYSKKLSKNSIELPAFPSGLYLITLRSSENMIHKTFKYILQ